MRHVSISEPAAAPVPASPSAAPHDASSAPAPTDRWVDPVELLILLGRHKRSLILMPLVAAIMAAVVSLLLPEKFTGVTRILPPQQAQSSAAAMLAQLGGLAGSAGNVLGIKNPSDLYIAMLQSDTISDRIIARFDLRKAYKATFQDEARRALWGNTRFAADKSGIIVIEADARDRKLAADMANAFVEELHALTSTLAISEAAQRRVFFEHQLQQAKDALADAEVALRGAMESGGLVSVDAQSRSMIETVARLRASISAKEIQIGVMRAYATPSNPELRNVEQELASMRQELTRLETGMSGTGAPRGDDATSANGRGVGNIRLLRDVKYREVMFELLAKQFELARVDESKEAPVVQVMDRAQPPERRTSPKRTRMVLLGGAGGFVAALLTALALEVWQASRSDPTRQARLDALRATWLGRRGSPPAR